MQEKLRTNISLISGMVAPVVFVIGFSVEGFFRHGYNASAMHISALSLGDRGWIQICNFLLLGMLLGIFALRLLAEYRSEKHSKAGPIILLVSAVCFLLSGPFVMDPMGTARENMTIHGLIHGILGGVVFVLMPITCFVFRRSMRNAKGMKGFARWSFIMGCVIAAALVAFTLSSKIPNLQVLFLPFQGMLQRAVIVPYLVWVFTFAWKNLSLRRAITRQGGSGFASELDG